MIDFTLLLLINALAIIGIYLATGEDMILSRPAMWLEYRLPEFWLKPVFGCPTCMASLHSILPFWLTHDLTWQNGLWYLIYIPALATLATIITRKVE